MFQFKVLDPGTIPWAQLDALKDRTIFQTEDWLGFLEASQGVKPLVIEITRDERVVAYFTGALFHKFGIRILGSSFPGWTTGHMGFNLLEELPFDLLAQELVGFAFSKLRCWHIEIYDPRTVLEHIQHLQTVYPSISYRIVHGWVLDISGPEDNVFNRMDRNRRTCIKKVAKSGLTIELTTDDSFVDDYYDQHMDVFNHQGLVPTYSKDRVRLLIQKLKPSGKIFLLRVRQPQTGLCIASGLYLAYNGILYAWGVAAYRSQLHQHPNESLHWRAIQYGREKGLTHYDMMGGGEYKKRYGCVHTPTYWIRVSRWEPLMVLRDLAEKANGLHQRIRAKVSRFKWM